MDRVLQLQGAHAESMADHVAVVVAPVVAVTAAATALECLVGGVDCLIVALCAVNVGAVEEHRVMDHQQLQQQQLHHQQPHRQQLDHQRDCSHLCYHQQQQRRLFDFDCLYRQAAVMMDMNELMKK